MPPSVLWVLVKVYGTSIFRVKKVPGASYQLDAGGMPISFAIPMNEDSSGVGREGC